MKTTDVTLLVFDEKEHFDKTVFLIGEKSFKKVLRVDDLDSLEKVFEQIDDNDLVYLVVHVFFTEGIKGIKDYKVSNIKEKYPLIGEMYISDGVIKKIQKEMIDSEFLDIGKLKKYFQIKKELGNEEFRVFKKKEIINSNTNQDVSSNKKDGVFLSHSSKDMELVNKFRDLILIGGLGISIEKIKFTSVEDGGLSGGINIPKDLENFLKDDMGLFIQFLSINYKKSRTCLNEEGAGWVLLDENYFIPILVPPSNAKSIAWIKSLNKGIKINNRDSLLNIYFNRKVFFSHLIDETHFTKKTEEFISWFDNKIINT